MLLGADEVAVLVAGGVRGEHALTHWTPDPRDEYHSALYEGEQIELLIIRKQNEIIFLFYCNSRTLLPNTKILQECSRQPQQIVKSAHRGIYGR